MIIQDIFPFFKWQVAPITLEDAAQRVSEGCGSLLEAPMTRLAGSIFLSSEQFEKALCECKQKCQRSFLMKSGPVITLKFAVENIHTGTIYHIIATEYPTHLQIHNVKMVTAPQEKPEDVEEFKKLLEGE